MCAHDIESNPTLMVMCKCTGTKSFTNHDNKSKHQFQTGQQEWFINITQAPTADVILHIGLISLAGFQMWWKWLIERGTNIRRFQSFYGLSPLVGANSLTLSFLFFCRHSTGMHYFYARSTWQILQCLLTCFWRCVRWRINCLAAQDVWKRSY